MIPSSYTSPSYRTRSVASMITYWALHLARSQFDIIDLQCAVPTWSALICDTIIRSLYYTVQGSSWNHQHHLDTNRSRSKAGEVRAEVLKTAPVRLTLTLKQQLRAHLRGYLRIYVHVHVIKLTKLLHLLCNQVTWRGHDRTLRHILCTVKVCVLIIMINGNIHVERVWSN